MRSFTWELSGIIVLGGLHGIGHAAVVSPDVKDLHIEPR